MNSSYPDGEFTLDGPRTHRRLEKAAGFWEPEGRNKAGGTRACLQKYRWDLIHTQRGTTNVGQEDFYF